MAASTAIGERRLPGDLKLIAAILERPEIERFFEHLGMEPQPPRANVQERARQDKAAVDTPTSWHSGPELVASGHCRLALGPSRVSALAMGRLNLLCSAVRRGW
jgi:hypothetical protein